MSRFLNRKFYFHNSIIRLTHTIDLCQRVQEIWVWTGLRDLKTISLHSTLAELGMDSMMAVEIKQTLEREFQVFLTPQDIRGMTFSKLQDLAAQTENEPAATAQGIIVWLRRYCRLFTLSFYTPWKPCPPRSSTSWPFVDCRGFVHHSLWTPYPTISFHREANHSLWTPYLQITFHREVNHLLLTPYPLVRSHREI